MDFNELVKTTLFPVLDKQGYSIFEKHKNMIRFQSLRMEINISFNEYDKTKSCELGPHGERLYILNNGILKELFHPELPIDQVTSTTFVHNLCKIFQTDTGIEMLRGEIEPLERISLQQSKAYTNKMIQSQVLEIASEAWDKKDDAAFIKALDKIDITQLPQSYQLKYTIAKKKR